MQQVLFRLDDICEEMNHVNFLRIKEIFDRYNVKPIIGVVPHNEDNNLCCGEKIPDFWIMMRELQAQGWTIAMHGYNHVYTTKKAGIIPINKRSEFAGVPYSEQLAKIKAGKEIFASNGIKADVFIAPSHSFDKNTLRALWECDFKYISDGRTNHPYLYMNLKFVPCKDAKMKKHNRFCCVCYHTNNMTDARFLETEQFLRENSDNVISFISASKLKNYPYFFSRVIEMIDVGLFNLIHIMYMMKDAK